MFQIVTGGSGSGKSEYAENLAAKVRNMEKELLYIATMKPFDKECEKRIERHREMRKEKGFRTIECYEDVETLDIPDGATVLLECMSNLLANEMYSERRQEKKELSVHLLEGITHLRKNCETVIVVTNEVFSDGIEYDKETVEYIKYLGKMNCQMANMADYVTEVVCKIPIKIK